MFHFSAGDFAILYDTIPGIVCRGENNDLAHYDSDDMLEPSLLFGAS